MAAGLQPSLHDQGHLLSCRGLPGRVARMMHCKVPKALEDIELQV